MRETRHARSEYKGKTFESTDVTETWYISPLSTGCGEHAREAIVESSPGSSEIRTGTARTGLPIERIQRVNGSDGRVREFKEEIIEWSEAPLPDDPFVAPPDFKQTKDWQDIEPELGKPTPWQRATAWLYRLFH